MATTQNSSNMTPQQANIAARQYLLASARPFVRRMATVTNVNPGEQTIITLDRMGIFTRLVVEVKAKFDITAAATAGQFGAAALAQQIQYRDFNNVNRCNMSGPQLYIANSLRAGRLYNNVTASDQVPSGGEVDTNIYAVPTAVATGVEADFTYDVPLAVSPGSNLTGAVLAQTTVSQHQLIVTMPSTIVGADEYVNVYNAGTIANLTYELTVYEYYLQPATLDVLPSIDLAMVYSLDGLYSDDTQIAVGSDKYISLPNNRSILRTVSYFQNGNKGTVNGTDLNNIQMLAGGNVTMMDYAPKRLRSAQRNALGGDLPAGVYVLDSVATPISTQLFGNVQAKYNIASVAGSGVKTFQTYFEEIYPQGTPLPGVASGY